MKTAVILHGMPSKEEYFDSSEAAQSRKHWLGWLQRQLILKGVLAQAPEMPAPYAPVYADWARAFSQFEINADTMLIGHSLGAGFLARWLSENEVIVGKVALVAPFLDPDKDEAPPGFFDFELDRELANKTKGIAMFWSGNDEREILESVEQLKVIKNIELIELPGKGHFTKNDMGTDEFPELLDWLIK